MPTPRAGGIFKGAASNSKKSRAASPAHPTSNVQDNDLLPEPCISPEQRDTAANALMVCKQIAAHPASANSSRPCSSNGSSAADAASDGALMDFWVLLQQTQCNLQDMLVDLETAKVELDLANQRANEAQEQVSSLRVKLSASEQKTAAMERQLQSSQSK